MDENAHRKLLGLVGIGARGRLVVIGVEQVRDAAMRNKLAYAIVAPDASENSRAKVIPLLNARRVRFIEGPNAADLGAAVGRPSTAAVGIVDRQLAKGIRALVESGPNGPMRRVV